MMEPQSAIDALAKLLRRAERIFVFTGAGVSTGSGIPDYRGENGVWKTRQPVYYDDFMSSEDARVEYWDYKLEGWAAFRDAAPNATHDALVRLERAGKLEGLVTQNIDGLHAKAGTSRDRLVEIHGTNGQVECQSCGKRDAPDTWFERFDASRACPTCPECNGFLKPATISFGQSLRTPDLEHASRIAQNADFVLALGSTLSVHPAASFPLLAARRNVPYTIINRGKTEQDADPMVTLRIDGDVTAIVPAAVDRALDSNA